MATTTDFFAARQRRIFTLPFARIALATLALLLLWNAIRIADEYYRLFALPFQAHVRDLGGSDFPAFYGGVQLFFDEPTGAYDADAQGRAIAAAKARPPEEASPWERYYNPPVYSLLFVPLTLFDLHTAYAISFLVNAVGLALLLGVVFRILQDRPLILAFFTVGLLTSQPLNYAFWHAQPTLFLAALLGFVYLQHESGKSMTSGLAWAALALKPHWLALPILTQRWNDWRQIVAAAIGLVVLLSPFLILGPQGTLDYLELLIGRGQGDVTNESFAEAVLSWPGFFRGVTGEARVEAGLLMTALTLLYYAFVRRRGNDDALPLAGAATFLLAVPHSHPQDWIMLVPGAAVLLRSLSRPMELSVTVLLLMGISLGLEHWSSLLDRRGVVYWPTLFAFGLLVWLVILSVLPRRARRLETAPDGGASDGPTAEGALV